MKGGYKYMISTKTFICQLSKPAQRKIKKRVYNFLYNYGYRGEALRNAVNNAMCGRLCDLSENININDIIK